MRSRFVLYFFFSSCCLPHYPSCNQCDGSRPGRVGQLWERRESHRARAAHAAGSLEPARSGRLHGGLLEFSGADVLFRREGDDGWQATIDRYLATYSQSGTRDGEAGILRLARRSAGPGVGLCARFVEVDDVRRQDAARDCSRWCSASFPGDGRLCTTILRRRSEIGSVALSC